MTPSKHTGARIRLYRRTKKITLNKLAETINKSASTLSKYETGDIVIDINTLYLIAEALGVQVNQLLDYRLPSYPKIRTDRTGFFRNADIYYAYVLFPSNRPSPQLCIFEIIRGEDENRFWMYFDVKDIKNYVNADYIYNGKLSLFEFGAAFFVNNPYNESDTGFIYAKSPFTARHTTSGIFTFLPDVIRNPCSTKIIFSLTPLEMDDELKKQLLISNKYVISDLKKLNKFIVY